VLAVGVWAGEGRDCGGGSGGGGAGAEGGDVLGGAALPGMRAGEGGEAEIPANVGDDVGDGAVVDVVVELWAVQAVAEVGVEGWGLGGVAEALDGVFDLANDAPAGGGAVLGGVLRGGCDGFGELAGEQDAAADSAGDALERDDQLWVGRRIRCGLGLGFDLAVDQSSKVHAHSDQVVEGGAVVLRLLRLLAGDGLWFGRCLVGIHERK
jgi:hypothetical protein